MTTAASRIAHWSIRHPWWAIGLWLAFVATAVVVGGSVETRQVTESEVAVGESGRAAEYIESAEFDDPATDNVLISPEGGWDAATAEEAAADVGSRLAAMDEVAGVGEPVPSPVSDALLVPITLNAEPDEADALIEPIHEEVAAVNTAYPDLRIESVGSTSIGYGIDQTVNEDLGNAGMLSLPITLGVLLVVFGALVAAGVPLVLGFSAVAAATGLWALASQVIPDIGSVPQLILLFGLAVGVDYSLFYLKREREERQRGHGTVDAVRIAAATSGRAVVVSALTTLVALAGLYLSGDAIFRALGTGVMIVVGVAMVGSLTVLPALLVKFGRAMDRPRIPLLWRLTATRAHGEPRLWPRLLAPAFRAPRTTAVVVIGVLVALAVPALGMNMKSPTTDDLPRSIPAVAAYDRMVEAYPSEGDVHEVVVRAPADSADAVAASLAELHKNVQDDPLFATGPEPAVTTSLDGSVSILDLGFAYSADDPRAERSLEQLRDTLVPAALASVPDADYAVTGNVALTNDYTSQQVERLPWIIGFVVVLTVGMMALTFRSVVVAGVAGALALLSVSAAYGVLTLVFQHGFAADLLGMNATGRIVDWVPLFLFVILLGLSMDYHVYVVSRIREAAVSGLDIRAAVRAGTARTAGVVTSAAAVMVAVFSIFATLSMVEMQQLGIGLAAAIAIDATLVRLFLLPSLMTVLGRANWWPGGLRPVEQREPERASVTVGA
ncbi:MAG TPA: MMPL family transporter [Jiangellaceae bacterium]